MMDVEELEEAIKAEKKSLSSLETLYEKEEDEKKTVKLEYKISRKEETIDKLIDRQQGLLDSENKEGVEDKPNKKDKNAEEKDEDVCDSCGGDLVFVETSDEGDIYECEKCKELYLDQLGDENGKT